MCRSLVHSDLRFGLAAHLEADVAAKPEPSVFSGMLARILAAEFTARLGQSQNLS